jgi:imidazolonepropionase-like amidohydrolase
VFVHTATRAAEVIALVGGRVIDGTGAPPAQQPWTVVIRGERIAAVGPQLPIPKDAEVIDVSGKVVLPGLIDMHGHLYARVGSEIKDVFGAYPLLFLAGGVTSVRSPGDFDPQGMFELKQRIARGEAVGPRIFMGGYYIDGKPSAVRWIEPVSTPEEAALRIEQWQSRIDVVKFYTNTTEAEMRAGIAAARRAGLPTTGHLRSITATRAIDLGIDGLEHGIYAMSELSESSSTSRSDCPLGDLDVDGAQVNALVEKIVQRRVAIDPTFVIATLGLPDVEPFTPDWRDYLGSPALVAATEQANAGRSARLENPRELECALRTRANALNFVKKVHERGGIILAGTDPISPYLLPGWGLHRELKYLTQAGLTPLEAIRAATHDAAMVLRRQLDLGTVTPGKFADLVVVSGNPAERIEDIGNTEIVFRAGRRYDPRALRASAKGKIQ